MKRLILLPQGEFDGSSMSYPIGQNMAEVIGYVKSAIERFAEVYPVLNKQLGLTSVNLICRGSSGAIVASTFATLAPEEWNCNIVHVKKDGERSHANKVSCLKNHRINIIIDDFIVTGDTIANIYSAIQEATKSPFFPIHCLIVTTGWSSSVAELIGFVPTILICSR